MAHETILILDLGSQYTQLIARRIREAGVFSQIVRYDISAADARALAPKGIVLSGGPASVYAEHAPQIDVELLDLGVPVLGICYGLQIMTKALGGTVSPSEAREYGRTTCQILAPDSPLLRGVPSETTVWMSHGDRVEAAGLRATASTPHTPFAAVEHESRPLYGVQFHPEVVHSVHGRQIVENFLDLCGCARDWQMTDLIEEAIATIRAQTGTKGQVVCGLSGGVDSAVTAAIVDRAIGDRLTCIFVDNGLLRSNEREEVEAAFRPLFKDRLIVIDASEAFLSALAGVTDPEVKRKRIGHTFIEVFREAAAKIENATFLAQGTLYPDVIESVSAFGGPTATIKSHHNVGGLPEELGFELVEPLRQLFKDEVRALGRALGIADVLVNRQPFPGPGLAIRILGEVTPDRLAILRPADAIVRAEISAADPELKVWQYFAALLPVRSVGVMGDQRTYEYTAVVRAVESVDGMTADWARLDYDLLGRMSNRIINEVRGINRVCYDISSKPPATIEWE
ncbi:MAG: glutamine-hydrolyzing GMP synthase [Planctomycetes bacterium]|nr:glutamine-hydrolyzing GMP synthase [Planctomycetota bacterium]